MRARASRLLTAFYYLGPTRETRRRRALPKGVNLAFSEEFRQARASPSLAAVSGERPARIWKHRASERERERPSRSSMNRQTAFAESPEKYAQRMPTCESSRKFPRITRSSRVTTIQLSGLSELFCCSSCGALNVDGIGLS